MTPFLIGYILSTLISVYAYYKEALSSSGAFTAVALGTLVFGFGGLIAFLIFISFFLVSFGIGLYYKKDTKTRRTYKQVLANGFLATVLIFLHSVHGLDAYYALFMGSVAVSAVDTFSSEIGKTSRNEPFHVFKRTPMPKGLSGAISVKGLLAGLLGALFYGLIALAVLQNVFYGAAVFGIGFLGTLIDSALGTVQVKYIDEKDNTITEEKSETTEIHSGFAWLDNDLVNFLTNLIAVLIMGLLVMLI